MRATLSTPRRLARARATRRPRSSRIGDVVGASREITNPTAVAQMVNQITSPMVDATVGVLIADEVANVSNRLVTEFSQVVSVTN